MVHGRGFWVGVENWELASQPSPAGLRVQNAVTCQKKKGTNRDFFVDVARQNAPTQ